MRVKIETTSSRITTMTPDELNRLMARRDTIFEEGDEYNTYNQEPSITCTILDLNDDAE